MSDLSPLCAPKRTFANASDFMTSHLVRNCPQDVPENAVLQLKRLRAVVLVISRRHRDNEIEFRDDMDRLPAAAKRGGPVELPPIAQGTA